MTHKLKRLLSEKDWLLADGATGSNLFTMGLQTGDCPEIWNLDHPDRIARHYKSFIDAGSDIILTNTFGGSYHRLKQHNHADKIETINRRGAEIACQQAAQCDREIVVAGSIGPSGEIMAPLGSLAIEDAISAFTKQALALQAGGVDVLWIETMSAREEVAAALKGAAATGLPIIATLSVDTNGRTMMGVTPADIATFATTLEPTPFALGVNCGVGAAETVLAILNMTADHNKQNDELIIVAKANCGVPEYQDGKIVYSGTAEVMSNYTHMVADAGARIIGGCCGTTPHHICAMRKALDQHQTGPRPELSAIEHKLGPVSTGGQAQLSGEMDVDAGAARPRRSHRSRRKVRS